MKTIKTQLVENQTFPADFPEELKERAILVKKLKPLPIEAIVRGYLYGSAERGYDPKTGKLATGEEVGKNLVKCSKFPTPLFTPSTKGDVDININEETMKEHLLNRIYGEKESLPKAWQEELKDLQGESYENKCQEYATSLAQQVKEISLKVYEFIAKKADEKGIIL
jgi:phosphoribosylaminoimidazole-succinocarboxamide synthase